LLFAIPLALWSAYRQDGIFDRSTSTAAFGLLSLPVYILGVFLVLVFSVHLKWLPAIWHNVSFFSDPTAYVKNWLLPSVTLAVGLFAGYMRLLRSDLIATLQSDYITMARAKGMSTPHILFRHALRPSSFSIMTAAAVNIGALIGGSIIIEQIFAINGIGTLTVQSIFIRDYEVVQICVAIFAVIYVLSNFVVDLAYAWLDPRIRHARALA
jgi:peptide/nickel transport system permease protein